MSTWKKCRQMCIFLWFWKYVVTLNTKVNWFHIPHQYQWQLMNWITHNNIYVKIDNKWMLFPGFKMYRQVVQLASDGPTSSGDRGGSHGECSAQRGWWRGTGGPRPCVQVEADGCSRGERPGNRPEQWQWANNILNFYAFSNIILCASI